MVLELRWVKEFDTRFRKNESEVEYNHSTGEEHGRWRYYTSSEKKGGTLMEVRGVREVREEKLQVWRKFKSQSAIKG
jgi:hypothetical protein